MSISRVLECRTLVLYYITDRSQFSGSKTRRRERLLAKIAEAARCGVDFIQLREKDLSARDLFDLAQTAVSLVREAAAQPLIGRSKSKTRETKLLVNSRLDVALAAAADGVHLTSADMSASEARAVWAKVVSEQRNSASIQSGNIPAADRRNFIVAVSCHTPAEVRLAEAHGADFAVFAPVFEKVAAPRRSGLGLQALREACRSETSAVGPESIGASRMPVLALGGVTLDNARACLDAGAAGIAAIRLFQEHEIAEVIGRLRSPHESVASD